MRVLFVRHGEAEESGHGIPGQDEARKLVRAGRQETRWLGRALELLRFKPQVILSSPLARAGETAEVLAETIGRAPEVTACEALAPDGSWPELMEVLSDLAARKGQDILVFAVGHQPLLSEMILSALGGPEQEFKLRKSACVGLDWGNVGLESWPAVFLALEPETAKRIAREKP